MSKFSWVIALFSLFAIGVFADEMKVAPPVTEAAPISVDPKGGGDFSGVVTAVESTRNSFTVENADGQVKMFTVSDEQKSKLVVGQKVTVSFTDQYTWPLPTKNIVISGQ